MRIPFYSPVWLSIAACHAMMLGASFGEPEGDEKTIPTPALLEQVTETQIFFPKSSAYLRSAERSKLEKLAIALNANPLETLILTGKTDRHGDQEFNSWLQAERSQAVFDFLSEHGIEKSQLKISAPDDEKKVGESVGEKETATQRRRVDLSLVGRERELAETAAAAKKRAETELVPSAAAKPEFPEPTDQFTELRKKDYHLADLKRATANTKIYFEYQSSSVRREYWRDLKQLAEAVHPTKDGAIAIQGFASPNLTKEEQADIAKRRAVGAAARLNSLGIGWNRIFVISEPGKVSHPAPHWRNHRVEFSPRRMLKPPAPKPEPTIDVTVVPRAEPVARTGGDSLGGLADDATIYFGANSTGIKAVDRKALKEIARMLAGIKESRTLTLRAYASRRGDPAITARRQNSVLDFLLESGAPEDRVKLDTVPASATDPDTPSWRLRRVELFVPNR